MRGKWSLDHVSQPCNTGIDHCCNIWNKPTDQLWLVMSVGLRGQARRLTREFGIVMRCTDLGRKGWDLNMTAHADRTWPALQRDPVAAVLGSDHTRSWRPVRGGATAAASLGCLVLLAAAPAGGNSGAADPALLLGAITTYTTLGAARLACGGDTVVWADRYEGFFYAPAEAKYGRTAAGAYACRAEARRGNYWDTSPLSSMAGHPSKSFPFTPTFVGS